MSQLKDIAFWNWEYLASLPLGEHDWIDYKDSRFLQKDEAAWLGELSEYLSAFGNYDGGYVVLGMRKNSEGGHAPDDGVDLVHQKKGELKEWLEDKLPGLVDPPLVKLSVNAISSPADKAKGVIVIHIPESENAPHQGWKDRFYGRVGSKNKPLKTRQIFDIQGRKKHPDLTAKVTIDLHDPHLDKKSRLTLQIENSSNVLCHHFGALLTVPLIHENWFLSFGAKAFTDKKPKASWVINVVQSRPLFPKSQFSCPIEFEAGPLIKLDMKSSDLVTVRLYADAAPFKDFQWPAADVIFFKDLK